MKRFLAFISFCLTFICGCTGPANPTPATLAATPQPERSSREACDQSLNALNKLSPTLAKDAAKVLNMACTAGIKYLNSSGAQKTAAEINDYLIDLLKGINPTVAAGVDIAAAILDNILGVPTDQLLTQYEISVLISFMQGGLDASNDFINGSMPSDITPTPTPAPAIVKTEKSRKWLKLDVASK